MVLPQFTMLICSILNLKLLQNHGTDKPAESSVLAPGSRPIPSSFGYELAIAESSQKPEPEHAAEKVKSACFAFC